jgi:hypothetical protein
MPGYHKKPNKHKATKDNSVYGNKPKFILGAIGNALSKGSSSFGRTAGNLLAGKLFGVDPSEAIKASNPNETTMNMMNMYTGGMLGRPMMKHNKKKGGTMGPPREPAPVRPRIFGATKKMYRVSPWSYILDRQKKRQHKTKDIGGGPQPYIVGIPRLEHRDIEAPSRKEIRKQRKKKK